MSAEPDPKTPSPDPEVEARLRRASSGAPRPGGPKPSGAGYALLLAAGLIGSALFSIQGRVPPPGGGASGAPETVSPPDRNLGDLTGPSGAESLSSPRTVAPPRSAPTPESSKSALGGLDLESAKNPLPEGSLRASRTQEPLRPRFQRTESLAPISEEAGVTASGLRVSGVDNPDFIEATPISAAEAAGAKLVKPKRPKCELKVRQIPPCAWKVERRGGYCIDDRGVVTTQQGVTSVEIPATKNGAIVPYLQGPDHTVCEPVADIPETPPR